MEEYAYSANYDHPLIAELYDRSETDTDDVALIRRLLGDSGPLSILECFSGTGRILVPMLQDGHQVTGIEIAASMSARAAAKIAALGSEAADRATLLVRDVLAGDWGAGFDVVVLGANALFELPSAETQERCIRQAAAALAPGGRLYVDNNDRKADWPGPPDADPLDEPEMIVFEGIGTGGTYGRWTLKGLGVDREAGVSHLRRRWFTRAPEGTESAVEYLCRKRPVSKDEVNGWLLEYGFEVLSLFGDRAGSLYTSDSGRAIFWARKQ